MYISVYPHDLQRVLSTSPLRPSASFQEALRPRQGPCGGAARGAAGRAAQLGRVGAWFSKHGAPKGYLVVHHYYTIIVIIIIIIINIIIIIIITIAIIIIIYLVVHPTDRKWVITYNPSYK